MLMDTLEGHNQSSLVPGLLVVSVDQFQAWQLSIDISLQGPIADREEQALVMGVGTGQGVAM